MKNELVANSCRICLTKTKKLRSLYKPIEEGDEPPYKMLLLITGIEVEKLEEYVMLPKNICKNCELSLSMAFEFRENAFKTQQIIMEYLKEVYANENCKESKGSISNCKNEFEDVLNIEPMDSVESQEDQYQNLRGSERKYSIENDELNDSVNGGYNSEDYYNASETENCIQQEEFDIQSSKEYQDTDNLNTNYFENQQESNDPDHNNEEYEHRINDCQDELEYTEEQVEIIPAEEEDFTLVQKNVTETNSTKPRRKNISKICVKSSIKLSDISSTQNMKLFSRRGRKPSKQYGHICDICGNVFEKRGRMMEHRQRHDKECRFCCEICEKKFLTRELLRKHMFSHSGGKPLKCEFCSRTFYYESVRKAHEAVHKGLRPYICDVCGKGFSYSHALKKHNLIHAEIKLYRCDYCNKDFRLQHHMKQHELTKLHQNAVIFAKDANNSLEGCGEIKEQALDDNILFIEEIDE